MTKNEAIVDIMVNFAYFDDDIHDVEIRKIKEIAALMEIDNIDIDAKVEYLRKNADDRELKNFAKSLAYLNIHLSDKEKGKVFEQIIEVIKADGKIVDSERYKAELLATNWQIDLKKL